MARVTRTPRELCALREQVIRCRACARLVRHRERVARQKVRRFADEEYWGRPLPGFGDPGARVVLVGLAPAAHGGNRTGRMFTGDESGAWLIRALHRAGYASHPHSLRRDDGLRLHDCYITAAVRCAPPGNHPTRQEIERCRGFLLEELRCLPRARVVIGLGRVGFEAALDAYRRLGRVEYPRRPKFAHGKVHHLGELSFIASYHPSQQNTFTRRLTRAMFDRVFAKARRELARRTGG